MSSAASLDILLTTDRYQFVALPALLRSVISNTTAAQTVVFHILIQPGETDELRSLLHREFPTPPFRYEIQELGPHSDVIEQYIRAMESEHSLGHLPYRSSAINCARFYLCDLFPDLDKVLYLDIDIIVQGDVADLFREAHLEQHDLAAISFGSLEQYILEPDDDALRDVDAQCAGFNNGVFLTRLTRWHKHGIVARFEHWMKAWVRFHREHGKPLFGYGSQTVMNLGFQGDFQKLPQRWNVWGLGFGDEVSEADLQDAGLLHWTGPAKPWKPNGLYQEYWQPYASNSDFETNASVQRPEASSA